MVDNLTAEESPDLQFYSRYVNVSHYLNQLVELSTLHNTTMMSYRHILTEDSLSNLAMTVADAVNAVSMVKLELLAVDDWLNGKCILIMSCTS